MGSLLFWLLCLPIVALFAQGPIERALAKFANGRFLSAWHFIFRSMWGFLGWLMLTALTGAGLNKIFPEQSFYIFSGSWITALPALLWGSIILWVVLGKREAIDGESSLTTVEGRIDAILSGGGSLLKFGSYAVIVLAAIAAVVLLGPWMSERISDISTSEAVLLGAMIIAWAIVASRRA